MQTAAWEYALEKAHCRKQTALTTRNRTLLHTPSQKHGATVGGAHGPRGLHQIRRPRVLERDAQALSELPNRAIGWESKETKEKPDLVVIKKFGTRPPLSVFSVRFCARRGCVPAYPDRTPPWGRSGPQASRRASLGYLSSSVRSDVPGDRNSNPPWCRTPPAIGHGWRCIPNRAPAFALVGALTRIG